MPSSLSRTRVRHPTKAPFGTIRSYYIAFPYCEEFLPFISAHTQQIAHFFLGGMVEAWPGSHNQIYESSFQQHSINDSCKKDNTFNSFICTALACNA